MAADRDLAVAFARTFAPVARGEWSGWEMTSATGVRGLRLLRESGAFHRFVFSEANPDASRVLRENTSRFAGTEAFENDARVVPPGAPFDYVDLDPYGSPAPFVPAALGSVRLGGIVAVTATDMMVLAGAQPSACWNRYGARPVRGRLGPEGGLRILLAFLSRSADALGRSVRPLLAYARDHYVRAYVAIDGRSPAPPPTAVVLPATWTGPWLGENGPYGPLWLGPLFDAPLVARLRVPEGAARAGEVERFIARLKEEVAVDRPFYYEANVLAARLGLPSPPSLADIERALQDAGFRAARTHARPEGFRTDAPRETVEGLVRRLAGAD